GKPIPPLDNNTRISEFKELGEAALEMSRRNAKVYESQKQFIENAAHELQTPLSISLTKLELLAAKENLSEEQLLEIDEIYRSLNRAVKLNKSLLLQARIENKQFFETKDVNITALVKENTSDLSDIFEEKNITVSIKEESDCVVPMNESLAQILVGNLLKNAFVHNITRGNIEIALSAGVLSVKNTGGKALDASLIFNRFYRSIDSKNNESTGLGLAIAKSICDNYRFQLNYRYDKVHIFTLKFAK
ncbi:MAG: HAMP domain-containing histidine kinase, partial [Prevotellaceae bacterium]|nr:HAMP domain-containing histidine kinase [Prevotellaceae bacterium]